jgi:hemerythrin-like metal-binding protein
MTADLLLRRADTSIPASETTADYVVWEDQYALGHDEIDRQHRQIVDLLNELYDGVRDGIKEERMAAILDGLCRYAETHFAFEEAVLAKIGYPNLAAHRRQHAWWRAKAHEFQARFQSHDREICQDAFTMARNWWLEHIQHEDRECIPYLPSRTP